MAVLDSLAPGSRVLVIRLRSLGDCVLTTPALHLLKQHRPDLEIGVAVEDRFRAVFDDNAEVSAIVEPTPLDAARFRPALTINFHGGMRSSVLTAASAARVRAGFAHFRQAAVYNVRIPRAQEILGEERTVHTAEHMASAMFYLGVPRSEVPRARLAAQPCASAGVWPGQYAVIHALASRRSKTWPAGNFAALAHHLRDQAGLEPVFIGAAGDDLSPFQEFRRIQGAPLGEIKSLLSTAALFAGNDSGPAHMAAAFGIPSVVLFGDSDARVWAPWRTQAEVIDAGDALAQLPAEPVIAAAARLTGTARAAR